MPMSEAVMNLPMQWPRLSWKRQHTTTLIVGLLHAVVVYGVHQSMQYTPPVTTEGAQLITQIEVITAQPAAQTPPAPAVQPKLPQPPKPDKPITRAPPQPTRQHTVRPVLSTDAPSTQSVAAAPEIARPAPVPAATTSLMPEAASTTNSNMSNHQAAPALAKATEPEVELPSSRAQYLNNPKPPYPATSKRLGEEGKVMIRVLISADGQPSQAQIQKSSGFERLDQAALETVLRWRFVPGKRGGVPEAMWFNVPINFVLD